MNLSIYEDKKTWLHSLDPRTKLIGVLIIFIISLCFNNPLYMVVISIGVFITALTAKAHKALWTLRYLLFLLVFFSLILWPFFTTGKTSLWTWGPLKVTKESLYYGIAMGMRLSTFVMAGLILLSTTKHEEMTNGLIKMKMPYPLAFAFSTALRLVPTFVGAGATIVQAQISRGLDLESRNILSRMGKFIPLAVPMFISAIRYTNLLSMALESKGFSPDKTRILYYEPRMQTKDWLIMILMIVVMLVCLYMRIFLNLGVIMPGRL
ncbi:MAG TPA: energy-coupling factor transporter transmembrane component T [Syntrophorhabdaceae bacterium]|nr:energy-coupling factor transporter transmembrane component T [Syntrophorhabdaceae bacterium]